LVWAAALLYLLHQIKSAKSCANRGHEQSEERVAVLDPFEPQPNKRKHSRMLEFDAWLNSAVYRFYERIKGYYAAYSARLERFNMRGFSRGAVEVISDGMTLGIAGLLVAPFLRHPRFPGNAQRLAQLSELFGHLL
jgi:hypothetical protein